MLFLHLFDLRLFGFVCFLSWCLGRAAVCDCGTPWTSLFFKSSCQTQIDRFQYYLAEMFPSWPSTKIVQVIRQKTWQLGGRGLFSVYIYIENFKKNLLVRNRWIEYNVTWQECCFGDLLPRLFKPSWYVKHHGRQGAGLIFRIYLYIENFKIILVWNH